MLDSSADLGAPRNNEECITDEGCITRNTPGCDGRVQGAPIYVRHLAGTSPVTTIIFRPNMAPMFQCTWLSIRGAPIKSAAAPLTVQQRRPRLVTCENAMLLSKLSRLFQNARRPSSELWRGNCPRCPPLPPPLVPRYRKLARYIRYPAIDEARSIVHKWSVVNRRI